MNNQNQREDCEKDTMTNAPKDPTDPGARSKSNCNDTASVPKTDSAQNHPVPDEPVWLLAGQETGKNVPNGEIQPSKKASINVTETRNLSNTCDSERYVNPSDASDPPIKHEGKDNTRNVSNIAIKLPVIVGNSATNKVVSENLAEVVIENTGRPTDIDVSNDDIKLVSEEAGPDNRPDISEQPSSIASSCVQVVLEQPSSVHEHPSSVHEQFSSVSSDCVGSVDRSPEILENTRESVL